MQATVGPDYFRLLTIQINLRVGNANLKKEKRMFKFIVSRFITYSIFLLYFISKRKFCLYKVSYYYFFRQQIWSSIVRSQINFDLLQIDTKNGNHLSVKAETFQCGNGQCRLFQILQINLTSFHCIFLVNVKIAYFVDYCYFLMLYA